MSDELAVSVADLRAAVDVILNEPERRFGPAIDLDAGYYDEVVELLRTTLRLGA